MTSYTYDTSHRMLTVKPPHLQGTPAMLVTNEYTTSAQAPTPVGWVKKQTFPDGGTYQFAYSVVNGKSTQTDVTDPRGFVRRVTLNGDGYTLSDTYALGQPEQQTTTYVRQAGTQFITSSTDALSRQTTYGYDAFGRVLTVTRMAGSASAATTAYTYEQQYSQIASVTDALNHTTTLGFDSAGNRTTLTDALNHTSTFEYNAAGLITKMTDPLQHSIDVTYGGDVATVPTRWGAENSSTRFTVGNYSAGERRDSYTTSHRPTQTVDSAGATSLFGYGTSARYRCDRRSWTTTFIAAVRQGRLARGSVDQGRGVEATQRAPINEPIGAGSQTSTD